MTKRFKLAFLEYEIYFIDTEQEYIDEAELNFEVDGCKTMSNEQVVNLLNENEQLKKELDLFKPIIFESDGEPVILYKKGDVE